MIGKSEGELVGSVYALRTFIVADEHTSETFAPICSINFIEWSKDGCSVADCYGPQRLNHVNEKAPHHDCSCGIYAFNNLQMLFKEYPAHASGIIAVVSLEGTAFEHEYGYRAEKATVVAMWINRRAVTLVNGEEVFHDTASVREWADSQENIRVYDDLGEMVSDYGLELRPKKHHFSMTSALDGLRKMLGYAAMGALLAVALCVAGLSIPAAKTAAIVIEIGACAWGVSRSVRENYSAITKYMARNYMDVVYTAFAAYVWLLSVETSFGNALIFVVILLVLLIPSRILIRGRGSRDAKRLMNHYLGTSKS